MSRCGRQRKRTINFKNRVGERHLKVCELWEKVQWVDLLVAMNTLWRHSNENLLNGLDLNSKVSRDCFLRKNRPRMTVADSLSCSSISQGFKRAYSGMSSVQPTTYTSPEDSWTWREIYFRKSNAKFSTMSRKCVIFCSWSNFKQAARSWEWRRSKNVTFSNRILPLMYKHTHINNKIITTKITAVISILSLIESVNQFEWGWFIIWW